MENLNNLRKKYLDTLKERSKNSRVYKPHQLAGLTLAEILNDQEHKSLYMKLAKTRDDAELIRLAKDIVERKNVRNKGAYFMKMLKASDIKKFI